MTGEQQKTIDLLSKCTFEQAPPGVFFHCEGAVFPTGHNNSVCYTSSVWTADVLAAILNEWAAMKQTARPAHDDRVETIKPGAVYGYKARGESEAQPEIDETN